MIVLAVCDRSGAELLERRMKIEYRSGQNMVYFHLQTDHERIITFQFDATREKMSGASSGSSKSGAAGDNSGVRRISDLLGNGLFQFLVVYLLLFSVVITIIGIGHFVLAVPTLVGTALIGPDLFHLAVFAFIGWAVLYSVATFDLLRKIRLDIVLYVAESLGKQGMFIVYLLIAIYINIVMSMAIAGGALATMLGQPLVALLVVLFYPFIDFAVLGKNSPGSLGLKFVVRILHLVGLVRQISAEGVLDTLRLKNLPTSGHSQVAI